MDWQAEPEASGPGGLIGNSGACGGDGGVGGLSGPASVTGVSVVSDAGSDDTYGLGDTIRVQVSFDGPVDVTGTPRLKIDLDPAYWGEKWAAYGLAAFGGHFTGTPNVGFGLSDAARDYRIGWRLTSAVRGVSGFELNLDATRREAANGGEPPEHGVMLRGALRF